MLGPQGFAAAEPDSRAIHHRVPARLSANPADCDEAAGRLLGFPNYERNLRISSDRNVSKRARNRLSVCALWFVGA